VVSDGEFDSLDAISAPDIHNMTLINLFGRNGIGKTTIF
jgi:hypothetical protein